MKDKKEIIGRLDVLRKEISAMGKIAGIAALITKFKKTIHQLNMWQLNPSTCTLLLKEREADYAKAIEIEKEYVKMREEAKKK